ncbi:MAG: ATP-dependent metalloprotease FtsH [Salibacteraceae bacterium]|jgi:cell division protease FtsH
MNKDQPKQKSKNPFKGPGAKKTPNGGFNFYWLYAIFAIGLIGVNFFNWTPQPENINYGEFKEMVLKGDVERVEVINSETGKVYLNEDALSKEEYSKHATDTDNKNGFMPKGPQFVFNIPQADFFGENLNLWQEQFGLEYDFIKQENWFGDILGILLPIALLIGFWFLIMRRMGGGAGGGSQIFNIGKSKATLFDKNEAVKVSFKDVAGLEEAKEEVNEIVDFLKHPDKYTALGAKIPQGALLVGPPGTGKTLLAKAVAGEAHVPFFSLSGSDFVEMFVGVGASRVRDLFKQAKEKAPSIIFIDEIDAIGRARGKSAMQGSNDERENTLNQLLTEMDGFGSNSGVIILAATNRADVLDSALLRPGRFDRQIHVDLPEVTERKAIFEVHLKPLKLVEDIDIDFLANQTPGFSGADIANLCNEAALIAARKKKPSVEKQDFLDAVDRIIGGLEKRSKIIAPKEKETIAFHEAGHATTSWLLEHAFPLVKVTIVPRGRSLGAAWYLPEERQITTTEQLLDEMCSALGGRAAEQVMFGKISTGALSDLEKVTKQAYAMVSYYGLDEKIGNVSYYDSSGQQEYSFQKPYSEKTAEKIDVAVSELIERMYQKAITILEANKDKLTILAKTLLEKEVIFKDDLELIFGKRTFEADLIKAQIVKEEADSRLAKKEKEATTKTAVTSEEPIKENVTADTIPETEIKLEDRSE